MRKVDRLRIICWGALVLSSGVAVFACSEDRAFYIVQNQVPQKGCVIPADDTSSVYRAEGVLDVSLGSGYRLYPLLRNDLPVKKPQSSMSSAAEPNLLRLLQFDVVLDLGGSGLSIPPELTAFSRPTSGILFPGGDRKSSSVEIFPDALVSQIKLPAGATPTVLARVTAVAESGDGDRVESLPFDYPVTLCNGCLVSVLKTCPTAEELTTLDSNVCGRPQDGPLVCCPSSTKTVQCLAGDQ
jgi:hypothetical protein